MKITAHVTRLGIALLAWAMPKLSQRELRMAITALQERALYALSKNKGPGTSYRELRKTLTALQNSGLDALSKADAGALAHYAKRTFLECVKRTSPANQPSLIVGTIRATLDQVDGTQVYPVCAKLTDVTRDHPRFVHSSTFTARRGDSRKVVVGPWLMEVGFEILYWIPYLRAQLDHLGFPKEQVIAISRGGPTDWYKDIADEYLEVLDVLTPAELERWSAGGEDYEGRRIRKTFSSTDFEIRLINKLTSSIGLSNYQVIMPSAMFALFRNVWRSRCGSESFSKHLRPAAFCIPERIKLPFRGPYYALKLYTSGTTPEDSGVAVFASQLAQRLEKRGNVVILSNQTKVDDHTSIAIKGVTNVFDSSSLCTPQTNLAIQTALVAHAEELHCTYGGFSYLGPLLGVKTVAYATNVDFSFTHLQLAMSTFQNLGLPQLQLIPLQSNSSL